MARIPLMTQANGMPAVPTWKANTAYKAGQLVTQGTDLYQAKANFTSGATFSAANWNMVGKSTYRPLSEAGTSFAAIGCSIEEGGTDNATRKLAALSYVTTLAMRSAGKLRLVRNAGISGETMVQYLARFDTDITPYSPKLLILGSAENDLKTDTPAQAIASTDALVQKARSIGALPILHTTVPRGSVVTLAKIVEFNWRLMRYAQANGLICLDFYGLLVSETDGTLYATAGNTSDGTHPTNAGAIVIADYILSHPRVAPLLMPGSCILAKSANDPYNLFTNGLFITDANTDGVPDNWTSSATVGVTSSLVTAAGVPGKLYQMDRASGATRATLMQSITVASGKFAVGDKLALSYRLQAETSTVAFNGMYGIFNGGAGGSFKTYDAATGPLADGVGYYEFTVPAGCTSIDFYVACDPGVGKVRLGQATLRNLTANAVA